MRCFTSQKMPTDARPSSEPDGRAKWEVFRQVDRPLSEAPLRVGFVRRVLLADLGLARPRSIEQTETEHRDVSVAGDDHVVDKRRGHEARCDR